VGQSGAEERVRTPATGRRVHLSGVDIDRLEDGRIVEHFSVANMLEVAEQLGLVRAVTSFRLVAA
jgi:predicted ester cyclase